MSIYVQIMIIIQLILLIYIGVSSIYYFTYAVGGLFYKPPKFIKDRNIRKFCVLLPGYKEDKVIINATEDALKQEYPRNKYDIYVIADSFKQQTLDKLKQLPVNVIEVEFKISTKAKALNKAMELIENNYDSVLVLDADNIIDRDFLNKVNNAFGQGYKAIQGHRTAKNMNTSFAVLDAISEEINNHIFRRGHRALGISSALIGSGMAFDFKLYKNYMSRIDSHAEDKELELKLFKDHYKIEFLDTAYVLDEKVSKSGVFLKQRSRWIANQMLYARKYFVDSIVALFNGNFDLFDKVFQYFLPPRILLLGSVYIILVLSLIFNPITYSIAWIVIFAFVNLAILISVPRKFYNFKIFKHLLKLPYGFILMIFSILNFQRALKSFNPTPHSGDDESNK